MPSVKKPQREEPKKAQPQVRPRIVIKFRDEVNLPYHKGAERVLNELGLAPWKNIVEAAPDATLEPVFVSVPEERVRELVNTARQRTSSYRPGNFFSFFALAATPGSDLQAVLRELKSWSIVENAYIDRGPSTPPAVNAGDDPRSAYQGYLSAAPIGIDAHYAWLWPGGDGEEAGEDYWAGYAHERHELAEFIVANGIRNICMVSGDAHMVAIDDGSNSGYAVGGRGGFPVLKAAALESPESEKGGPYSIGNANGTSGAGVAGRRQFAVCEVIYDPGDAFPLVKWTAFRAEKKTARPLPLLTFEFLHARQLTSHVPEA